MRDAPLRHFDLSEAIDSNHDLKLANLKRGLYHARNWNCVSSVTSHFKALWNQEF